LVKKNKSDFGEIRLKGDTGLAVPSVEHGNTGTARLLGNNNATLLNTPPLSQNENNAITHRPLTLATTPKNQETAATPAATPAVEVPATPLDNANAAADVAAEEQNAVANGVPADQMKILNAMVASGSSSSPTFTTSFLFQHSFAITGTSWVTDSAEDNLETASLRSSNSMPLSFRENHAARK